MRFNLIYYIDLFKSVQSFQICTNLFDRDFSSAIWEEWQIHLPIFSLNSWIAYQFIRIKLNIYLQNICIKNQKSLIIHSIWNNCWNILLRTTDLTEKSSSWATSFWHAKGGTMSALNFLLKRCSVMWMWLINGTQLHCKCFSKNK